MKVYLLVIAIVAAAICAAVPIIRHIALVGNALTPVRARDVHSTPIPRLGGVTMLFDLLFVISAISTIPYLSDVIDSSVWTVALGAGLARLLDVISNLQGLDWMTKLADQILAANVMVWQGVQPLTFPVAGLTTDSSRLFLISTAIAVATTINAVNFVDGLDGLAADITGTGSTAFFLYIYVLARATGPDSHSSLTAIIIAALTGVCVDLLPYNFNPATIFIDDSETVQLGLVSVASAIIVTRQIDLGSFDESCALSTFVPVLLSLTVLLLSPTDMIMVIARRTRKGLSPTHPDRMRMHHRLPAAGYSYRRAALVMYLWAVAVSFPVAVITFSPLPWMLVRLTLAVLFTFVVIIDLVPGARHDLCSMLRRYQDYQKQRIVASRNVLETGEVARPTEGQASQGAVVSAAVSIAPAHHPEKTDT